MKKRKSPTNRFSFELNKQVEDEAINWNGKDQKNRFDRASGWQVGKGYIKCEMPMRHSRVDVEFYINSSSGEKPGPDYELRGHQYTDGL